MNFFYTVLAALVFGGLLGILLAETKIRLEADNPITTTELIKNCEKDLPPGQHCEIFIEVRKDG